MSDRDTPETDEFADNHLCEEYLHPVDDAYNRGLKLCADLARRLERERDESREQIANLTQDCYYWRKKCAEARQDWHDLNARYQAEQQLCRQYKAALDNVSAQIHALAEETKRKGA
jgi:hypothetical protein